jgi:hypothetical protein
MSRAPSRSASIVGGASVATGNASSSSPKKADPQNADSFFQTAVPGSGFDADDDNDGSRDGSRDNDDDDADDGPAGRARITFQEPQRTRPVVDMDSFDPSDVKLPITINIVAVRETLFADAPFISKNNKAFWRRMVDSKQFMQILSASYNFLSQCVSDSGAVLVDRLNNVQQSPLVGLIATSLTDIFYSFKRLDRDILLSRLPEVVHFMVLQALQTALPRHHRLYSSVRFREIMLDWCTELIWGMRTTNCRANREWLFHDAQVGGYPSTRRLHRHVLPHPTLLQPTRRKSKS